MKPLDTTQPPLEWAPLWAAMNAKPGEWIKTTEAMSWQMLECLPPRKGQHGNFLVGEPERHNEEGLTVYAHFKQIGNDFYARYSTVIEFLEN